MLIQVFYGHNIVFIMHSSLKLFLAYWQNRIALTEVDTRRPRTLCTTALKINMIYGVEVVKIFRLANVLNQKLTEFGNTVNQVCKNFVSVSNSNKRDSSPLFPFH